MPLMVREDGRVNKTVSAITTHTSVFSFHSTFNDVETADQVANVNIKNLALLGNAKKSENSALSGGVIGISARYVNLTVFNNLVQKFCIAYKLASDVYPFVYQYSTYNFIQTNIFDSYNTMLYLWGVRECNIDSCHFIGAGGPVMICDHVGNDENTGAGGFVTNVYVDSKFDEITEKYGITLTKESKLESWVAGTEGWFETYQGSGALAQQIKSYDRLFNDPKYGDYGKKLLSDSKINIIAVFKSGSAQGLTTSMIRGSFNDSAVDYKFNIHNMDNYIHMSKEVGLYDLVKAGAIQQTYEGLKYDRDNNPESQLKGYSDEQIASYAPTYFAANVENTQEFKDTVYGYLKNYTSQGVFLVTDSGAVAFPGTDGWYADANINGQPQNKELVKATKKYMYVYLFNGMGAVIQVDDVA